MVDNFFFRYKRVLGVYEILFRDIFILTKRYTENCGCSLSASELHPPILYIRRTTQQPFQSPRYHVIQLYIRSCLSSR